MTFWRGMLMLTSNLLINAFQTGKADELRNRSTKSETVPVYELCSALTFSISLHMIKAIYNHLPFYSFIIRTICLTEHHKSYKNPCHSYFVM